MSFKKYLKYLKEPRKLIRPLGDRKFFNWLPDKYYLKLIYWAEMRQPLDLKNPQTFNEKLQWLKLYDRKPEYHIYVDKYDVRKHIAKEIGDDLLIPIIGIYKQFDEIIWEDLPNKFVIKCTHGSACNIICKNKNELDIGHVKKRVNKWLKKSWYWFGREWVYKNVEPRILIEEYMEDETGGLRDFKILCFNGEPKIIQVHTGRFSEEQTQDFLDLTWKKTVISQGGSFASTSNTLVEKPINLSKMIELSEKLAKNFIHIRIDWYEVNGKLYFGEMTFFDGSGFTPFDKEEYDLLLGSWINLPLSQ